MLTSTFDYHLPDELIAQEPGPRGASRLLHLGAKTDEPSHRSISDFPSLLRAGDLVVVNDTRVLAARLIGQRPTGGQAELLLIAPTDELPIPDATTWECLGRPRRRLRPGSRIRFDAELDAEVLQHRPPDRLIARFTSPPALHLDRLGHVPLPPYIRRPADHGDRDRYQTVYAENPGAIAAPTAGLHFTTELVKELESKNVGMAKLTLHVGPGTFRPVTAEHIEEHQMDAERFVIDEAAATAIETTRADGGRIIAIGTTVVRTLESVALAHGGQIVPSRDSTDLFITPGDRGAPGFEFQVADLLLTNFHLPRSTLLMLVSAFAGLDRMAAVYRTAVQEGYRFYSYGDAMLLERWTD